MRHDRFEFVLQVPLVRDAIQANAHDMRASFVRSVLSFGHAAVNSAAAPHHVLDTIFSERGSSEAMSDADDATVEFADSHNEARGRRQVSMLLGSGARNVSVDPGASLPPVGTVDGVDVAAVGIPDDPADQIKV
jgi:hypothetical protein